MKWMLVKSFVNDLSQFVQLIEWTDPFVIVLFCIHAFIFLPLLLFLCRGKLQRLILAFLFCGKCVTWWLFIYFKPFPFSPFHPKIYYYVGLMALVSLLANDLAGELSQLYLHKRYFDEDGFFGFIFLVVPFFMLALFSALLLLLHILHLASQLKRLKLAKRNAKKVKKTQ